MPLHNVANRVALRDAEVRDFYRALRRRRPRGSLWNLRYSLRDRATRMELVRCPKLLVVACHLAAIEMQRFIRGYLIRMLVSLISTESQQRIPLASTRAAFARMHYRSLQAPNQDQTRLQILTTRSDTLQPRASHVGLIARYLEAKVRGRIDPSAVGDRGFTLFAVTRIQAWVRMLPWMRYLRTIRMVTLQRAAKSIQRGWAFIGARRARRPRAASAETLAARSLQKAWLSFTNRRIFSYFRDMIEFREQVTQRSR